MRTEQDEYERDLNDGCAAGLIVSALGAIVLFVICYALRRLFY